MPIRSNFAAPAGAALATAALLLLAAPAQAALVAVTVQVQNLTPAGGIAFAPLHLGFNQGTFDAFNAGSTPGAAITSVAEGGSGSAWQPAFAAADPTATRGVVGGLLLAGATASKTFTVDTDLNPYFTFAAMVVPSNDFFIGNDSPTEYKLFDAAGHLQIDSITEKASDIWDNGSEIFDPAAAAFVGDNSLRTAQGGVTTFNFSELAGFDGFTTGAGYVFHSGLTANQDIYRIGFSAVAVPEPSGGALLAAGLLGLALMARRRGLKR